MNQNLEIMLNTLAEQFPLLDSIESKVENIKERIFLIQKTIANRPQPGGRGSKPKSKPQIITKDNRSEIDDLRSKLVGKPSKGFPTKSLPFNEKDMEGKDADAELKRALDKAFKSI